MNHKRYMDIERLKPTFSDGFVKGNHIVIQEKIDGANASFQYDVETDSIQAFSRKQILGLNNNLRGFWEWTQRLDKELIKNVLGENLRMFCEWLVPHTVKYPNEKYNHAYCYDVFNISTGKCLPQSDVEKIVRELNLTYVPVFYDGEFTTWEECLNFVGKTELGGEYGEGIVIKDMTRLNDTNTKFPFYTKIVCEKFAETKGHKETKVVDAELMKSREENKALIETIVTKARVRKLINKMVDENIIPENWNEKSMGVIAKNLTKAVYEDCVKEENDIVKKIADFGRVANGVSMLLAKGILAEKLKDENKNFEVKI